jgi:hypothetical protein
MASVSDGETDDEDGSEQASSSYEGDADGEIKDEDDNEAREQSNSSANEDYHQFNIGRFCARRAGVFRELTHWEVSSSSRNWVLDPNFSFIQIMLFKTLLDEVNERPGRLTKLNDKEQWLLDRGIIEQEWQRVKELMEKSRIWTPTGRTKNA